MLTIIDRNGLSQVWYSSEITGTIIVQCIPVLRTVLRGMHKSWSSKRRSTGSEGPRASWTRLLSRRPSVANKPMNDVERVVSVADPWRGSTGGYLPKQTLSATSSEEGDGGDMWPLSGGATKTMEIYTTKSFSTEWHSRRSPPILDWGTQYELEKGYQKS